MPLPPDVPPPSGAADQPLPAALPGAGPGMADPPRPALQFSLQSLLVLMGLAACGLAAYRAAGWRLLAQYLFLLFATGPWFAHLVGECLPLRRRELRSAAAYLTLLALFFAALQVAEASQLRPAILYVGLAAVVLWVPQFLAFLWWRSLRSS